MYNVYSSIPPLHVYLQYLHISIYIFIYPSATCCGGIDEYIIVETCRGGIDEYTKKDGDNYIDMWRRNRRIQ